MRLPLRSVACFVAVASSAAAQSRIDAGVSAGVVKLTDQRSEQVVSGVLEYAPRSWLSLYAIPAVVHVSDGTSGRTVSSSGLGDLPVVAAVSRAFPTPWSPTLGAALVAGGVRRRRRRHRGLDPDAEPRDRARGALYPRRPAHAHGRREPRAQRRIAPVGALRGPGDRVRRHLTGDPDDPATPHQERVRYRHHGQDRLPLAESGCR